MQSSRPSSVAAPPGSTAAGSAAGSATIGLGVRAGAVVVEPLEAEFEIAVVVVLAGGVEHPRRLLAVDRRRVRFPPMAQPQAPDRNLALELVRVTEAAALAASRWMGRGDKEGADGAAVDAMRVILETVQMDGIVVIGEGEKDEAPMLYNGEFIGDGNPPQTDIAVDPIDGTTLTALGRGNAIAVIAVSERGTMFDPGPCFYMEKIAVGPDAVDAIDITKSATENLEAIAEAKGESVRDITAVVLDRDRHREPHPRDPRSRCPHPPDPRRRRRRRASRRPGPSRAPTCSSASAARPRASSPPQRSRPWVGRCRAACGPATTPSASRRSTPATTSSAVLTENDLVRSDNCFFAATGITDGELLQGVHYDSRGATTQSLVMRSKSGTVRLVNARHKIDKLAHFSSVDFS